MVSAVRRRLIAGGSLIAAAILATQGTAFAADNLPPEQPVAADLLTGSKPCAAGVDRPYVRSAPALTATLRDRTAEGQSAPDRLTGQVEVWWQDAEGIEQRAAYTSTQKASGSSFQWQLLSDIPADTVISWRVRANDGQAWSPWSDEGEGAACQFVYDKTPPAQPVVTSPDFPDDTVPSGGVGRYATFTMDSPSDDVVTYRYNLLGGPLMSAEPDEPGGPVSVRLLPTASGTSSLAVQAYDRAGNASPPTTFFFRVKSASDPVGEWKLTDPAGSRTAAATTGAPARTGIGVGFGGAAPSGTALTSTVHLDGTGHGFLTPDTSVVDTRKTFAVGAWVRPERTGAAMTAVSQDAVGAADFTLGLSAGSGSGAAWSFAFAGARVTAGTAEAGQWAYLLGAYDSETGTARLYVNGIQVGSEQVSTGAAGSGDFQIGRARGKAGYGDRWQGDVGDVRAYDRVVVSEEVTALAKRQAVERGRWALESSEDGLSPDSHSAQPLGLEGGATIYRSDFDALVGTGHLDLDGSTGFAATEQPVVDTADSFSIGVVVRLADEEPDHPMTVLSQGGENGDAFKVRYVPSTSTWELAMSDADEPGAAETVVSRAASPDGGVGPGQWLAVVCDRTSGEITLYVNGQAGPAAHAPLARSWSSTGGLQVGRGHTADGWGDYLHGSVDEVQVFSGALTESEIAFLGTGA